MKEEDSVTTSLEFRAKEYARAYLRWQAAMTQAGVLRMSLKNADVAEAEAEAAMQLALADVRK